MIDHLLTETVQLRRRAADGARDRHGNAARTFDADVDSPARVERERGQDLRDGRDATLQTWRIFLPAGTDLEARDRVVVDGTVFEVDGPPERHRTPTGGEHHVEAQLRLVEGT